MTVTQTMGVVGGGSFLIEDRTPADIFTLEDLTDEQRQISNVAEEFSAKEIMPALAQIEAKQFDVTKRLLREAGELGLMSVDIPEEFGGLEMDKVTSAIIADRIGGCASFSVAFSAHVGIGTLPIVWYGTPEQKQKYLPKLSSGTWIGAYALSEASSGSDAMNIRTRAELTEDGSGYILNGEKMWITNAGFADLFTVFAKVGEKFTAFLIQRDTPGLTIGAEEHKLGIRGSSTCPLILSDCRIPLGNVLGEVGKGHHIAFNILNIGRFKLGAACIGAARASLANGVHYAKERKAFGKSICEFGLVQEKIAACAVGIFVGESMAYRTVGMIDAALAGIDKHAPDAARNIQKQIEEYAVECSILKVWGSEMVDRNVDHVVQIFGGYGYVEEYPAERAYRDSRINRIFEGTNEINRLIITGWLMKRAMSGQLPLMPAVKRVMDEVISSQPSQLEGEGALAGELQLLANAKKLTLFAAGAAAQKYMQALTDQQEVMAALADMIIEVYAMESCILRTLKMQGKMQGEMQAKTQRQAQDESVNDAIAMAQIYCVHSFELIAQQARKTIATIAEGDLLRTQMAILRRLSKYEPVDTIALQRKIARRTVEAGRYTL